MNHLTAGQSDVGFKTNEIAVFSHAVVIPWVSYHLPLKHTCNKTHHRRAQEEKEKSCSDPTSASQSFTQEARQIAAVVDMLNADPHIVGLREEQRRSTRALCRI